MDTDRTFFALGCVLAFLGVVAGVILFSGSLSVLAVTDVKVLGATTPAARMIVRRWPP